MFNKQTRTELPEEITRLLGDPTVQKGFDFLEQRIIEAIAQPKDGSQKALDTEHELCVELRVVKALRRGLSLTPQRQAFKDALKITKPEVK